MNRAPFVMFAIFLLFFFTGPASTRAARPFPAAAHGDVMIEWWYVNAHVTTNKGRHLALIGAFFRLGNGKSLFDQTTPQKRAHYLIYAVTDLDKKTERAYSLADANSVALLKQTAPLMAAMHPGDPAAQQLVEALNHGGLPPPHQIMRGVADVRSAPFALSYGTQNTFEAVNPENTAFVVNLDAGGADKILLTLTSSKPAMAVGGRGETGINIPSDMHYFSLTRCKVAGSIDTGLGKEGIAGGSGWIDHQWGNSWTAQTIGWDWFGVQLDDGTDILLFRMRDLATGKVFFPMATFMDKNGRQTVTRNIRFTPDGSSLWKSPKSGVSYPLRWTVAFPEQHLSLRISPDVLSQEMPTLGAGGAIWEGSCRAAAAWTGRTQAKRRSSGVVYMELVGYGSPAVKARLGVK